MARLDSFLASFLVGKPLLQGIRSGTPVMVLFILALSLSY